MLLSNPGNLAGGQGVRVLISGVWINTPFFANTVEKMKL